MYKTAKFVIALVSVFCFALLGSSAFAQGSMKTFEQQYPEGIVGMNYHPTGEFPEASSAVYQPMGRFSEASWMIGYQVLDPQGGYLGQISSFVIDNTNGRVALVVLSDVPGIGAERLAVPYKSITRIGESTFEFNPGRMVIWPANYGIRPNSDPYIYTVTSAPGDSAFYGIPSKITPDWVAAIYRHYGQEPYWTESWQKPLKELELYSSDRLMGAEVQTAKGMDVARIDDLVIDSQSGHLTFALLTNIKGRSDAQVAVPFGLLSRRGENVFVLNTTTNKLVSAPSFNRVADMHNLRYADQVYGYFGLRPYWTE
jgi:sporulation protein YlmC with PRC-barrel domain